MEAILAIEPTLGDPGLIAYECPKCVYVTSELVQPRGRQAGSSLAFVPHLSAGTSLEGYGRMGRDARADFKTGALKERSRCGAADAITLQGALRFMIIGGHEKDPAR
jgi:hypothetical protein